MASHTSKYPFLVDKPIPYVNIALVGIGTRGKKALNRFQHIKGATIALICDTRTEILEQTLRTDTFNGKQPIATDNWRLACESDSIDLVYVCTDWLTHAEIAIYAMQCGKHVAIEVPAAMSVEDCWALVDTAEQTKRHCVMLENCCYDAFELTTLNMVQQGLLGDLIHADCGYIHDLRSLNFPPTKNSKKGMNRGEYNQKHNGNIYPTHGLGPVCMAMGINRGDRMCQLVSVSSRQQGITAYAKEHFGQQSEEALRTYQLGDMNTTIVSTQRGATIMIQHNISNPRPYSRIHALTGTEGFCQKYPIERISVAKISENFLSDTDTERLLERYKHPFLQTYWEKAQKVSGDHFFDYIMDARLIHCLNEGLPTDINVYDAASWSCLTELTELSVRQGGRPIEIPDFTNGRWAETAYPMSDTKGCVRQSSSRLE